MKKLIFLSFLIFIAAALFAQPAKTGKRKPVYFSKEYFRIGGTAIPEEEKENAYDRLPASYKDKVRKEVWDLSKTSAGINVSFRTNSTAISARWTVLNNLVMNHMAPAGIKGLDLYVRTANGWQYVNTGKPSGKENEVTLISNMSEATREYQLFLPLYDGMVSLEIGIDSGRMIEKPVAATGKPIIFYGTSITQGGCASRPGMAHTNIISRKLHTECINLGFSGNGRMEKPIAELMADTDALFYVIDCLPNMTAGMVSTNTAALVETIRKKKPYTPIVLVENTMYENAEHDLKLQAELKKKNEVLKNVYDSLLRKAIPNIYYINTGNELGNDHEGTVDGVHLTDLGFSRFADFLLAQFRRFKLVPDK